MTMENRELLMREWSRIFEQEKDYYLYGAANMARELLRLAKETGVLSKIKGCLVTEKSDNPDKVDDVPVLDVRELNNQDVIVLVPHGGVYKREIVALLENLGMKQIVLIHHLGTLIKKETTQLDDHYMNLVQEKIRQIQAHKSALELEKDLLLREKITQMREANKPDFSEEQFYQSFEQIGLPGRRPTLYRIEKYGIDNILSTKKKILDIGCNVGFFDMSIASRVKSIDGVEYDETLVQIAETVKEYVEANNCHFYKGDFIEWLKEERGTYDVIFSFAIHHWLNITPERYVEILDELLTEGGYICIESHDLFAGDVEYEQCIELLLKKKYQVVLSGEIMDDGAIRRNYRILYKGISEDE